MVTLGLGCNPEPTSPNTQTSPPLEHVKPPNEGAKIIGLVMRRAGDGAEVPPNGGVVFLEDAPKDPAEGMAAKVELDHKSFSPAIAVIPVGGTVTFGNKDALPHHVFSPDIKNWDTGILKNDETVTRKFDSPGVVSLLCNIHPEMLGYVLVIPSSYFGRIGADGRYVIPNVKAGTYKVTAWSPRLPSMTQSVTVTTGAVTSDFMLPAAPAATK